MWTMCSCNKMTMFGIYGAIFQTKMNLDVAFGIVELCEHWTLWTLSLCSMDRVNEWKKERKKRFLQTIFHLAAYRAWIVAVLYSVSVAYTNKSLPIFYFSQTMVLCVNDLFHFIHIHSVFVFIHNVEAFVMAAFEFPFSISAAYETCIFGSGFPEPFIPFFFLLDENFDSYIEPVSSFTLMLGAGILTMTRKWSEKWISYYA